MPVFSFNPLTGPETMPTGGLPPSVPGLGTTEPGGVPTSSDTLESLGQEYTPEITSIAQQSGTESEALELLRKLAASDPAYYELYIKLLAERENNEWAWKKYEDFNNSYYQRTTKDLEAAGMNPWLALVNGIGQSGTGSVSSAGSFSTGVYQTRAQEKIAAQNRASQELMARNQNTNNAIMRVVATLGTILAAIIFAMG